MKITLYFTQCCNLILFIRCLDKLFNKRLHGKINEEEKVPKELTLLKREKDTSHWKMCNAGRNRNNDFFFDK